MRAARSDLGRALRADRRRHRIRRRTAQFPAIPHHPQLSHAGVRGAGAAPAGARDMAVIRDFALAGRADAAGAAAAPAAHRLRAQGEGAPAAPARPAAAAALSRPDPAAAQGSRAGRQRLLAVPRHSLSGVRRRPGSRRRWCRPSRSGLLFCWSADLIAIIALLGSARFFLALAGLDVGTSFGGIGSSREVMIASLAEPAMLMIVFTLALIAGSTQLSTDRRTS